MLHLSAEDIRNACAVRNWSYRKDKSNESQDYTRNIIRHEVLPALSKVRPGAVDQVLKTIWNVQEHVDLYANLLDTTLQQNVEKTKHGQKISREFLKKLPNAHLLLYHWLSPKGFSFDQCTAIANEEKTHAGAVYSSTKNDLTLYVNSHFLSLENKTAPFDFQIEVTTYGTLRYKDLSWKVDRFYGVPVKTKNILYLSLEKNPFPFGIRSWKEGDRIQPLGMEGSKLVSDILIDEKIPLQRKKEQWVLEKDDEILCLSRIKASEQTRHQFEDAVYLRIRFQDSGFQAQM